MRATLLLLTCLSAALSADFRPGEIDTAAAGINAERIARIPNRMQEFVDAGKAAGIVTVVARHGHIALLSAVGYQDLEFRTPMRADAIFRVMSMTKPMTGTAAMILVDEGRLAVIDPLQKFLPEFQGQQLKIKCPEGNAQQNCLGKPSRPITLFDVLTHTSGIQEPPANQPSLAAAVAASARLPLEFEPGTAWRYRTAGTNAAGRVVEAVSGIPYERFMTERIFAPLGMQDTTYFPTPAQRGRIATLYTYQNGSLQRTPDAAVRPAEHYGQPGAGAYSTARDLARFYQMILNQGTLNGHRILSAAAVQFMTSVQTGNLEVGFAPGLGYGLGWGVVKDPKGSFRLSSLGSFGHGGAHRTYAWVDPAKDMFCILLMQRTNEGGDTADEINAFLAMAAAAIEK